MKILHVEAGRHLYGGALQVCFLMRGLRAHGIDSVLACPMGSAIADEAAPFAQVVPLTMRGDLDPGLLPRLRSLIRAQRPNVVHLHSRRGVDLWGALAARLEGVPVVLSRRVDNPEPRVWASLKYRLYDRVIAISQGIRQVLLSEGLSAQQVSCVPSAVDTQRYSGESRDLAWFREEFGLPPGALAVGMIAQFIERKGHAVLLQAVPQVAVMCPDVRFVLFGQGPLESSLRQQVAQSPLLRRHVIFGGFRKDLDRVLPCLDVVVHPAWMEGLGVSLLQAAACGVPLIGARAGGIPEVIRPGLNGELIEPGDASSLAQQLVRMLSDAHLRECYGRAGRTWVEEHFSVVAMVQGNIDVYTEVLKQRH